MNACTLCKTCRRIVVHLEGLYHQAHHGKYFWHHESVKDLLDAVEFGCQFCSAFWGKLSRREQAALLLNDLFDCALMSAIIWRGDRFGPVPFDPGTLAVQIGVGPSVEKASGLSFRDSEQDFILKPLTELSVLPLAQASPPPTSSTSSNEVLELVETWTKSCNQSHEQCGGSANPSWHPTRLLDLSGVPGRVCVVDSAEKDNIGRYMTLSHRWPSDPGLTLNKESQQSLKAGVKMSSLPRAVQDAIVVCRRLNVHYLWVDLLCIIQQDTELRDWRREALTMDKVYGNSYLNISGLASKDTSCSFFVDRSINKITATYIRTPLRSNVGLGPGLNTYEVIDLHQWRREVEGADLNLRAWVLQERLLSPRTVHYGNNQIYWECCKLSACEMYPLGVPAMHDRLMKIADDTGTQQSDQAKRDELYEQWDDMLFIYSKCSMSDDGDKLVALSGIANRMMRLLHDEYVVGMWRRDLELRLLWQTVSHHSYVGIQVEPLTPRRHTQYIAPTFSWASVEGGIKAHWSGLIRCTRSAPLIAIKSIDLNFTSQERTGAVERGSSMTLRCRLQQLKLTADDQGNIDFEVGVPGTQPEDLQRSELRLDEHIRLFNPVGRDDLYCTPVLHDPSHAFDLHWNIIYHLLFQVIDPDKGVFRRIGVVSRWFDKATDDSVIEAWKSQQSNAAELPCVAFEDEMHTIQIV